MENPIYVGPMFVGHAKIRDIKTLVEGCPRPGCGWIKEDPCWNYCPNCGHRVESLELMLKGPKPDFNELVAMRKRVRLSFNHYRTLPPPGAELVEDYWLPAPPGANTSLYVDVAGGQSKFAANLSFVDANAAVEAFETDFKAPLASLARSYDTWSVQYGFFCWL